MTCKKTCCALALLLAAVPASSTAAASHVLFFLIDDLGYADVGYHGNPVGSKVITPTIDAMSARGVRLENYYVNYLCSPTRTSLMSGRYAYTIGMNAEVIVDGAKSCMPTSVATIADRLQQAGWATSAYGKWDMGMTSWGCTPTCRGFDHFFGFYNAFNDYFTHMVGVGLDLRNDTTPVPTERGRYFTELVTSDAVRWLRSVIAKQAGPAAGEGREGAAQKSTFAYLAHESNHAPLQVPAYYIDGGCADGIPASQPERRIVCGMMRAVDSSLKNVTDAYKELGVWDSTIVIMSTDNGGNSDTGGSNHPLRGQKATSFEGGVRGVGWVGGGFASIRRGVISKEMIHVSDWYPTIVHGIAGLDVAIPADGTPPLDGVDAWPVITSASAVSARTEMLLQLSDGIVEGFSKAAIRVGNYKLITGPTSAFTSTGKPAGPFYASNACVARDDHPEPASMSVPYIITNATSPPFCPTGWVPPPESETGAGNSNPIPPPDVTCTPLITGVGKHAQSSKHPATPSSSSSSSCVFDENTKYTNGTGVFLFNIDADPTEKNDLSSARPDIVQQLMARLNFFVNKSIYQERGANDPASNPKYFNNVWTPWDGNPNPAACSPPPQPPTPPCNGKGSVMGAAEQLRVTAASDGAGAGASVHADGSLAQTQFSGTKCSQTGWCSNNGYAGPAKQARLVVDGTTIVATGLANAPRKIAGLHGFILSFDCGVGTVLWKGSHNVTAECACNDAADGPLPFYPVQNGVSCTEAGTGGIPKVVPC